MEFTDNDIKDLSDIIFAEVADESEDVMMMVGSSVLNRLNSNRIREFGSTIKEIGSRGYYAVSEVNHQFYQTIAGCFDNIYNFKRYLLCYKIAYSLIKEIIPLVIGMFFFTLSEEDKCRKENRFDFSKVFFVATIGNNVKYNIYTY